MAYRIHVVSFVFFVLAVVLGFMLGSPLDRLLLSASDRRTFRTFDVPFSILGVRV